MGRKCHSPVFDRAGETVAYPGPWQQGLGVSKFGNQLIAPGKRFRVEWRWRCRGGI